MPVPAVRSRIGRRRFWWQTRRDLRALVDRDSFGIPQDPVETVPPKDERFTIEAVVAIECYTPSHAAGLQRRLRELGFDEERVWGMGPASSQLRAHRESMGESWSSLGVVQAKGHGRFHQLDLPDGLSAGFLWLYTFTAGITWLVALFVTDEDCGGRLDVEARRIDYEPRVVRVADGYRIDAPSTMKAEALRAVRLESRQLATAWVASMLPGSFAAGSHGMPSAEVITTAKAAPFEGRNVPYLDFTGLDFRSHEVWESEELPAWRLHTNWDDAVMTLAGRRSDVLEGAEDWSGDEKWRMAQRLQDTLGKNLVLWGVVHLVSNAQRRLALIRDESLGLSGRWRPLQRLKRIDCEFLRQSLESRTIAAEVAGYVKSRDRFERNASEWHGVDRWADQQLLDVSRNMLWQRAVALTASEERLRDGLMVETTMRSTIVNLRIQMLVVILSFAAIILSLIALSRASA